MNKVWLGYVSSFLFVLAGVMMILDHKISLGIIFIVLAIVSFVLRLYMNKNPK